MQEDDKTIPNLMGAPTISGNSYALGARGIDRIMPWTYASGTRTNGTASYPVYDGHGNMILTLAKNGTNFTHGNERSYDPWGGPGHTGDPTQGYCANLGHVTDDESGLIYMRARYYEPSTGRFLSEDPARDGANWYVYCWNEPVLKVDPDGREAYSEDRLRQLIALFLTGSGMIVFLSCAALAVSEGAAAAKPPAIIACILYGLATAVIDMDWKKAVIMEALDVSMAILLSRVLDAAVVGGRFGGQAKLAVIWVTAYSLLLIAELNSDFRKNGGP